MNKLIVSFSPRRDDSDLELYRSGDALTINGKAFDFSPLPNGATLPASAIDSPLFCGDVERIDGVLHVSLILPHGPNPPHHVAFPSPLTVTQDGEIEVPK